MLKKCLGIIAALAIVLFGYLLFDCLLLERPPGNTKQQDISIIRQTFHIPDTIEPFFSKRCLMPLERSGEKG